MNNQAASERHTITIDELILDGFEDINVSQLQAGISEEINSLLTANNMPRSTQALPAAVNANQLSQTVSSDLSAHAIGRQIAQAVYPKSIPAKSRQ